MGKTAQAAGPVKAEESRCQLPQIPWMLDEAQGQEPNRHIK